MWVVAVVGIPFVLMFGALGLERFESMLKLDAVPRTIGRPSTRYSGRAHTRGGPLGR